MQRVDEASEMMNESMVECRDDAVGGRLQGDELDESDSPLDMDDATNGVLQYACNVVFGDNDNELNDVVRVREGVIVEMNMKTNVSMRSADSRTVLGHAGDEPGVPTNVGGSDVMPRTVRVHDRDTTNVRGTRLRRSSFSSSSRKRRRTETTPPLRGPRRTLTGRVTRRRPTSTLRGGPGTSLYTGMSSAAIHLGVTELISWADGLTNAGGGKKSPSKREPSLANGRPNTAQEPVLSEPSHTWRKRLGDGSQWES